MAFSISRTVLMAMNLTTRSKRIKKRSQSLRLGFGGFLQEHFPVPVFLQGLRGDFGGETIRGYVEFRGPEDAVENEEALIGIAPVAV